MSDEEDSFEAFDDDEPILAAAVGTVQGPPPITEQSSHSLAQFGLKSRTEDPEKGKISSPVKEDVLESPSKPAEEAKSRQLSERDSINSADEASISPQQDAVIPLSDLVSPKKPTQTRPKPQSKPKPKPILPSKSTNSIPILNSLISNTDTYDLDQLTDQKRQKNTSITRKSNSDFVKMNREMAGKRMSTHSRENSEQRRGTTYRDQTDVEGRFYQYRKNVEEKVKRLEEEKLLKEKALCTFQPNTNKKSRSTSVGHRSSDDFYHEMMRHKKDIEDRVKYMREEAGKAQQSMEEGYFRPVLCEKSKALVSAKGVPDLPVHEKLYQAHRLNMQRQLKVAEPHEESVSLVSEATSDTSVTSMPFMPTINSVSRQITRHKPIETHLLEDAERRRKQRESLSRPSTDHKLISLNSEQLLIKRFKEEINSAWDSLDDKKTGKLNYIKTGELLHSLYFVSNNPKEKNYEEQRELVKVMWMLMKLEDDGCISKDNFETLALAVMNFQVKETEKTEPVPSKPSSFLSHPIGRLESGIFLLNPGDCKRLHSQFKPWYTHRLSHLNRSSKNPTIKNEVKYTHKPTISLASQRLVASRSVERLSEGHGKIEDFLIAEAKRKQERQKELLAKAEREEMKECVFAPQTNLHSKKIITNLEDPEKDTLTAEYLRLLKNTSPKAKEKTTVLYNLATLSQQRRKQNEKTIEEIDLDAQQKFCTFMPNLRRTRNYVSGMGAFTDTPKGVEKTVERLAKARKAAQEIRALRETGFAYRGKKEQRHSESKNEGPLVVLAVQVSGRAEELRVRPSDNLDSLISAFAAQHRLSSAETALVQEQLRSQYDQATGAATDD